jgi:ATP-dependent Lon protease
MTKETKRKAPRATSTGEEVDKTNSGEPSLPDLAETDVALDATESNDEISVGEEVTEIPDEEELPLLPLRGTVVLPTTLVPLAAAQARSIRLIDDVMAADRRVALVMQKDPELAEGAGPDDILEIGSIASIHQMMRVPDGSMRLAVQGLERVRVVEMVQEEPYLIARVRRVPEEVESSVEVQALGRNTLDLFQRLVALVPHLPDELVTAALNVDDDPRRLVYLVASNLRMEPSLRQELLEIDSVKDKLKTLNAFLTKELDVLELGKKIQTDVQEELSKSQREYFLREQLKAIQKELGESSESEAEVDELRSKIDAAGMSEEAEKEARRELGRLAKLPTAAAEYGVIKTYLDWLTSMPWNKSTEREIKIGHTREILDQDHYGLDKVKDRVLEYLAVRQLKQKLAQEAEEAGDEGEPVINREPILCFVGPPGVGKTSLAQPECHLVAFATSPRFEVIVAPTSARCRVASCRPFAGRAPTIRCSFLMRSTSSETIGAAIHRPHCSRCWILNKTTRFAITISTWPSICPR